MKDFFRVKQLPGATIASGVLFILVLLFSTCNIGLGSKVDLERPVVNITSPAAGSYLRYSPQGAEAAPGFRITGTASDDILVQSISITWTQAGRSIANNSRQASYADGEWSLILGPEDITEDGQWTLTAIAVDNTGKTSSVFIPVYIDNKAPSVLATSPLTYTFAAGRERYRPNFYRNIDLKGEVYDASPLERVEVSILDSLGNVVLGPKLADGTNTWAVRFDSSETIGVLSDGGRYYYDIVALDSAGNVSSRFYHRYDIFPLLNATGGYVSFPSMNSIGKLDQGLLSSLDDGLTASELYGIRHGNEATASYSPDFTFLETDANSVQWLNLAESDAVIGLDVPIVGTILPASDGSSIDLDSVAFSISTTTDPVIEYTQAAHRIALNPVGASLNFELQPQGESDTNLAAGNYIVWLSFQTSSGLTVSDHIEFGVSSGVPILREINTLGSGESPMLVQKLINAPFIMGGTSRASDDIQAIVPSYAVNDVDRGSAGVSSDLEGNWILTVPASIDGSDDGSYTYTITASEGGMSTSLSRIFIVDTKPPELTVFSPTINLAMSAESGFLNFAGAANDHGGSGVKEIRYKVSNATEDLSSQPVDDWDLADGTITWSGSLSTSGMSEGLKRLWIAAIDSAGNLGRSMVPFSYDLAPPVLGETAIGTADTQYRASDLSFGGTASDSNALQGLSVSVNGAAPVSIDVAGGGSWSWTFSTGSRPDGSYALVFTARDIAGKTTNLSRSVVIDKTEPSIFISPVNGWQTGIISVNGTASDANLALVEYRVGDSGPWSPAAGTVSWTAGIDVASSPEGAITLNVRATDRAGNIGYTSAPIQIDRSAPRASIEALGDFVLASGIDATRSSFSLSGLMDDAAVTTGRRAVSANLSWTKDGLTAGSITLDPAASTTWSWDSDSANLTNGSNDGIYSFNLSVIDAAGKESTAQKVLRVDTTVPNLIVSSPLNGSYVDTPSVLLSGSVLDTGGSGFDGLRDVEYRLLPATDWIELPLSGTSWNAGSISLGASEGLRTLEIRASDAVGNVTEKEIVFSFDQAPPTISVSGTTALVTTNAPVVFTGTAGDTNAISTVSVSVNGAAPLAVTDTNADGNPATLYDSWTWTLPDTVQGDFVLDFVASDSAGRTTTVRRSVLVDTTAPTTPLIVNAPASYVSDSLVVDGTSSDPGTDASGVALVSWRIAPRLGGADVLTGSMTGTDNWFRSINLASLSPQGPYTLYVRATDRAGNESSEASLDFDVDSANPEIQNLALSGGAFPAAVHYVNSNFSISFDAFDSNRLKSYSISRNGTVLAAHNAVDISAEGQGPYAISLSETLGSGAGQLPDGEYAYVITLVDIVNRSISISRTVFVDTASPVLVVTAPSAGEGVEVTSYTIRGSVEDGEGKGVSSLEYSLNSTDGLDGDWLAITRAFSWNVSGLDFSSGGEGPRSLWVRASDGLNPATLKQVSFFYDIAPPALTETLVNTEGTQNRNSDLMFSGTISDSNASGPLSLSVRINGGAPIVVGSSYTADGDPQPWSYLFDVDPPVTESVHSLVFTATDAAGKTHSLSRSVRVDRSAPVLTDITVLSGSWLTSSAQPVSGTVVDSGSGVQRVEYRTSSDGGLSYGAWQSFALSGTSFTGTVVFNDGVNNRMQIRAMDNAGNLSSETAHEQIVWVDTTSPTLDAITSPLDTPLVNGMNDFAVSILASDIGSGLESAQLSASSTFSSILVETDSFIDAEASLLVPAASISALGAAGSSTNVRLYLRIRDNAGRFSTTSTVNLTLDRKDPGGSFLSHANGTLVNKTINLSGTASDENGLGALGTSFQVYNRNIDTWETASSGSIGGEAAAWAITAFNTLPYSSQDYDSDLASPGQQLRIRYGAVDAAGNTGYIERMLLVDQDSDRPIIRLSNINPDGSTTLKMSGTVFGSVSDDDGVPASVSISTNGIDWVSSNYSNGSWEYQMPAGDGLKTIYFRVVDSMGTVFSSNAADVLDRPKLQFGTNDPISQESVSFRIDTITPQIGADIKANGLVIAGTPSFGGGAANTVQFEITATDANGIESVIVEVDGLPAAAATASGDVFTTAPISLAPPIADGDRVVLITATDNSGLSSTATRTIRVDNTAPNIVHQSPLFGATVNGDIELRGLLDDGLGSGVASVRYKVGKDADIDPLSAGWTDVSEFTFASWRIDFKGINTINQFASSVYGVETSPGIDLWDVPFIMRIEDAAGNVRVTSKTDYRLVIDPSGDKPTVAIIYPDPLESNRTLGGTIRIFGSSDDDDGVASVWMQIDVNNDGVIDALDVANGVDWYNGGNGRQVNGSVSWNMTINADGEFNPSGDEVNTIQFRVRARDINGLDGNWSPWQRIDVDKNVPKIGSSEALRISQGTTIRTYISDMYIRDNWIFEGSIEDESGIDTILISGDINGSLATRPEWFESMGSDNWRMKIPVETSALGTGRLAFTVRVFDKSTPQMESSINVSVNYDNEAPLVHAYTGALPVRQSNNAYTLSSSLTETGSGFERIAFWFQRNDGANTRVYNPMESRAGNANRTMLSSLVMLNAIPRLHLASVSRPSLYTLSDPLVVNNKNIRRGGIINIGGLDRLIVNVNHGSGTIEWAEEVPLTVTEAWPAYVLVVDNMTIETPIWNGDILESIANDDGDGMVESVERSGGLYSWTASIDSRNIPDGPLELHWVAFDKAGNMAASSLSTRIENNPPLLASVILGTDLDGNDLVEESEEVPAFNALDGAGKMQSIATVLSNAFKAKGLTTARINVVGGNGALQYALTESTSSTSIQTLSPGNLRADEESAVSVVSIALGTLQGIGDGVRSFVFNIWDSTESTTPGIDSLNAVLTVPMEVDVLDEVDPLAVIDPFYWNSEADNSLYLNSRLNGHIELEADLPATPFDQTSGVFDRDPKVSGMVSIRGSAYDETRLSDLYLYLGDGAADRSFTFNGAAATRVFGGRTYSRVASFNTASGSWTASDQWADNGWRVSIVPDYLDQSGHRISWQLDIDTARISGTAALDRLLRVVAEDAAIVTPNASNEAASPGPTHADNNVPSYRMDVVPYIRTLSSALQVNSSGLKDANIRTTSGEYSVIRGNTATYLTVTGFNLAPIANGVRVVPGSQPAGIVGTTLQGAAAAHTLVNSSSLQMTNNLAASGYLVVVGGTAGEPIPSLNNINNNTVAYNREEDEVLSLNRLRNDNRFLRMYTVTSTGITNATFPNMIMDGDTPYWGYVQSGAAGDKQVRRGSTNASNVPLLRTLSADQLAMTRDDSGRYHIVSVTNFNQGRMHYINHEYASLYQEATNGGVDNLRDNGASSPYWNGWNRNQTDSANNNAIDLDTVNYTPGLQLGRFQRPILRSTGTAATAAGARFFLMFYDSFSGELVFRNWRVGTFLTGSTHTMYGNYRSNLADITATGGDNTRKLVTNAASEHFAMAVTSEGYVVVAYYDQAASNLVIRYSATANNGTTPAAVTGANPAGNVFWSQPLLLSRPYVGWYPSMIIDGSGRIHISAYDTSGANLSYILMSGWNDSNPQVVTVDSFNSVGYFSDIKIDDTGRPAIAYYNSSETGTRNAIRLARYTGDVGSIAAGVDVSGFATGAWEVATVPVGTVPRGAQSSFLKVNLGFTAAGVPVVGYAGDALEYSRPLGE